MRVVFFGSHPHITNGYSKVVYHLCQYLGGIQDLQVHVFGFQKFDSRTAHEAGRPLTPALQVYDAWAHEDPKQLGFGVEQAQEFVDRVQPDVCIVYNDFVVVSQIVEKLTQCAHRSRLKLVVYLDQVYTFHRPMFINVLLQRVDHVITFSPYWSGVLQSHGLPPEKLSWVPHGFCSATYYPVPVHLARMYYGIRPKDFVVLNLNRNQPRKRWDTCMMAMAEVVKRTRGTHENPDVPMIKLFVGTTVGQGGAWNLLEIYENELRKRGLTLQEGLQHLICIDHPQNLSDFDINVMYNAADIGINTAMGEGWGLCNFEQAALGVPQVVPRIGAYTDFFDDDCAILVTPRMHIYADFSYDSVGGETALCHYEDFVAGILRYYHDPELRKAHGRAARNRLLENYSWDQVGRRLETVLRRYDTAAAAAEADLVASRADTEEQPPHRRGSAKEPPAAAAAAAAAAGDHARKPAGAQKAGVRLKQKLRSLRRRG
jgi:glycosyltransferase involved in cell wall biosynthesis